MFPVLTNICILVLTYQLVSSFAILVVDAQPETAFTVGDVFEIPTNNSSIRFAVNGTYTKAVLKNGAWIFENLYFPNFLSTERLNLTVSARDCNVTINPYLIFNRTSRGENVKWVILSYTVIGQGTQVFNLGLDPEKGQLDAILDGEFIGLNHGWSRDPDGTLTITKDVKNVTLWYYGYPDSYIQSAYFFDDHYVVIGSTGVFAIVMVVAAAVTRKRRTVEA